MSVHTSDEFEAIWGKNQRFNSFQYGDSGFKEEDEEEEEE